MATAKRQTMGALAWDAAAQLLATPRAARQTAGKLVREVSREFRGRLRGTSRRSYDAAAGGRNTAEWKTTGASANAEVAHAGTDLRNRSRDLDRNDPNAHKILSAFVNNVVGDGLRISFDDKKAQQLWDQWITECDTAHDLDFYGLTWLMVYGVALSGESLGRRRPRMMRDKLTVPLQIQCLESDYIASVINRIEGDGSRIVQGIQFDPLDRRVAYWLYPYHPGDAFGPLGAASFTPKAIPAEDIAHMYEATRAGQVRGVPMLHAVMRVCHDLLEYDQSHLVNKRVQSNVCAVVTGDDPDDQGFGVEFAGADGDDDKVRGLEPGAVILARNGKTVSFNNPTQTQGYSEFKIDRKHDIAAGGLTPYELASGDLSRVNYSSIRAGLIEYRRLVKSFRNRVVIPLWVNKVVRWFLDAAIASGELQDKKYTHKCHAPKFEEVDRLKEALANRQLLENGEASLQSLIRSNGDDPAVIWAERKADKDQAEKLGLPVPGTAVQVAVAEVNAGGGDPVDEPPPKADPPA